MTGRTIARLAATAAAVGIGTAATLGSATAEPAKSPLDTAIDQLTATAGPDPAAHAGADSVAKVARLITAAHLDRIAGGFAPFAYQAPTIGCGDSFITLTAASGVSGEPGPNRGIAGGPGTLRFQATPAVTGFPIASGLTVAWLNVSNGRSGIDPLDDQTDYHLPGLSKTVDTGPGTVVASMWGTINYPTSLCVMTPTVGMFTVADTPAPAPAPGTDAVPAQPVPGSGSAPTQAAPESKAAPAPGLDDKPILTPGGDTPAN
ncbi:hypothetical protein [Nocardia pseudobrasiliensis]|uniref:Uncharacterized protein n=1 Tax=Nocardia pseudobrasiliensis TaxID=45979 RepID=A0A370IGU0_9NOCA|nr:hypothetical protein [Nocardia pseudobrasiliensis]RDI68654.1 hypothetical protein DFR76_101189 [Nocardia pseudobrasiliensis]